MRPDYSGEGLDALLDSVGSDDPTLPEPVNDALLKMQRAFPVGMHVVLSDGADRSVEFSHVGSPPKEARSEPEQALLSGWLKEVNWKEHTAQLHRGMHPLVKLRFDETMNETMRQCANQYVELTGSGRLNESDLWGQVTVQAIAATSRGKPFDRESFLSDPTARPFDPDDLVPMDLTEEEWTSFLNAIREGRKG